MTTARERPKLISSPSGGGRREPGFWWGSPLGSAEVAFVARVKAPPLSPWGPSASAKAAAMQGDLLGGPPSAFRGTLPRLGAFLPWQASLDGVPARMTLIPKGERHFRDEVEPMLVQNRAPCRLRTTAGSGPRLWRGAGGLRRARPRNRGRAPSAVPPPPFGRQPQPHLARIVPHPPRVRRRRRTSCFVSFRRPHPQRPGSTLAVRPPHLPRWGSGLPGALGALPAGPERIREGPRKACRAAR